MVIEKPRVRNIAYIPSLKQGFVDLTPEQEAEFTKQASDCILSFPCETNYFSKDI